MTVAIISCAGWSCLDPMIAWLMDLAGYASVFLLVINFAEMELQLSPLLFFPCGCNSKWCRWVVAGGDGWRWRRIKFSESLYPQYLGAQGNLQEKKYILNAVCSILNAAWPWLQGPSSWLGPQEFYPPPILSSQQPCKVLSFPGLPFPIRSVGWYCFFVFCFLNTYFSGLKFKIHITLRTVIFQFW